MLASVMNPAARLTRTMARALCALAVALAIPAAAQAQGVVLLGETPPKLGSAVVVQPEGATTNLSELRTNGVVMLFATTRDEAGRRAIARLADFALKMRDEALQCIWVTTQDPADVQGFLKSTGNKYLYVFAGIGATTLGTYRIDAMPKAIMIQPDGKVSAMVQSSLITASSLRCLARGVSRPAKVDGVLPFVKPDVEALQTPKATPTPVGVSSSIAATDPAKAAALSDMIKRMQSVKKNAQHGTGEAKPATEDNPHPTFEGTSVNMKRRHGED